MFIDGVNGEEGEVITINGNRATVKITAHKECEKCRLCTRVSPTEMTVEAFTNKTVHIGDRVTLFLRPGIIVQSAAILYIFPLIGMLFGYFAGKILFRSLAFTGKEEMFPALLSLVFLFLSFVPIRLYDRKRQKDKRFKVLIKED